MKNILKMFSRNWFLKIIALILSFLIYVSLKEPSPQGNHPVKKAPTSSNPIDNVYQTMTNSFSGIKATIKKEMDNIPETDSMEVLTKKIDILLEHLEASKAASSAQASEAQPGTETNATDTVTATTGNGAAEKSEKASADKTGKDENAE